MFIRLLILASVLVTGTVQALEAQLPVPKTAEQLRRISDDRYLSTLDRKSVV